MGLDMYLTAKVSTKNWSFEPENNFNVKVTNNGIPLKLPEITGVTVNVGYWRKANAIHGWFVDNCQNGIDECQKTHVSMDRLLDLKDACQKTLDSLENTPKGTKEYIYGYSNGEPMTTTKEVYLMDEVAETELPPTEGFFFGTSDIDEWYIQDLKDTLEIIKECEELTKDNEVEFYYQSSW
jgi:hypothetical protein